MRRSTLVGSAIALAVTCGVGSASPALANETRSGPESATGLIVVSTATGSRQVLYSVIHMRGVFDGNGRVVEVESVPGDPDNVNRDDFVFRQGTISVKSTTLALSIDVDPQTCAVTADLTQDTTITGGTGLFTHAMGEFDATVHGRGVLPRASDGTCDTNAGPLREKDFVHAYGHMSL